MTETNKVRLAVFASGTGSNADKICQYFQHHPSINVTLIVTNRKNAGVLEVASRYSIDSKIIPSTDWASAEKVLPVLKESEITHIILAGFLLLIPSWLVNEFQGRILNIHPALLPKYGGKGMYGMHVHQQVKNANDTVSGITIHVIDEHYDEGDIVFQDKVALDANDSAEDIAQKVLKLEHYYYPRVIEKWVRNEIPAHIPNAGSDRNHEL